MVDGQLADGGRGLSMCRSAGAKVQALARANRAALRLISIQAITDGLYDLQAKLADRVRLRHAVCRGLDGATPLGVPVKTNVAGMELNNLDSSLMISGNAPDHLEMSEL
jgi:hypothetical protein